MGKHQNVPKRAFCSSPHCNTTQKTMKFEDKHFSNFVHIPYYDVPKRHVCAYSEDRTSDTALLPRPRTRRNPNDWSPDDMLDRKYRSQSVGGIPINGKNFKKNIRYPSRQCHKDEKYATEEPSNYEYRNQNPHRRKKKMIRNKAASTVSCSTYAGNEEESELVTGSSRRSIENKKGIGDTKSIGSIEEHEYLQFLLRITEDIIINNYILNEDIERVFKQHMEMNKNVLDEKKMEQHITNLSLELNISEDQIDFENRSSLQVTPSSISLLCLNTACECETPKHQFEESLDIMAVEDATSKDFDDRIYYRHSLGRVTECTEPSNSSTTVVARISNQNFMDFSTLNNSMITAKSEIVIASEEDVIKDLHLRETSSEIVITDKTSPEDSLKNIPDETGKTYDIDLKETGKTYIIDTNELVKTKHSDVKEEDIARPKIEIPLKVDCGTDTAFAEQRFKTVDVKIQTNLLRQKVNEQSIQTSPRLLFNKPSTFNRSTQSTSMVSNKKCDTEDLIEYVLVTNKDLPPEVTLEDEIPLTNRPESEGGLNTFLELKLLGDDYDLTPERDTSEKYFFMTDAATMCHPTIPLTNIDEGSLLLGNMYELDDESALQRMLNNRDTYVYRKSFGCEDEGSSSSDHVDFCNEYSGWLSDKTDQRYSSTENFGKFETILKMNSCTSMSSISAQT